MQFDDESVLEGAVVDLTVATAAAVGTITSATWAKWAWVLAAVMAVKTVIQGVVADKVKL